MRITPGIVAFSSLVFVAVGACFLALQPTSSTMGAGSWKSSLLHAILPSRSTDPRSDSSSASVDSSESSRSRVENASAIESSSSDASPNRAKLNRDRPLHPQAIAMAEEIRKGENPERFLFSSAATPFDKENYLKDPEAYLEHVEPGRIWQTAQPGEGVEPLRAPHGVGFRLVCGETVKITAQTAPRFPVTFLATGAGSFENDLGLITVASDATGMAQVVFATAAEYGRETTIVATSPVASGRQVYYLSTTPRRSE